MLQELTSPTMAGQRRCEGRREVEEERGGRGEGSGEEVWHD